MQNDALVKILTKLVIPLDMELAVYCPVETHTKLGEVILAATVFMWVVYRALAAFPVSCMMVYMVWYCLSRSEHL